LPGALPTSRDASDEMRVVLKARVIGVDHRHAEAPRPQQSEGAAPDRVVAVDDVGAEVADGAVDARMKDVGEAELALLAPDEQRRQAAAAIARRIAAVAAAVVGRDNQRLAARGVKAAAQAVDGNR